MGASVPACAPQLPLNLPMPMKAFFQWLSPACKKSTLLDIQQDELYASSAALSTARTLRAWEVPSFQELRQPSALNKVLPMALADMQDLRGW